MILGEINSKREWTDLTHLAAPELTILGFGRLTVLNRRARDVGSPMTKAGGSGVGRKVRELS